jgi:hypothetical protein
MSPPETQGAARAPTRNRSENKSVAIRNRTTKSAVTAINFAAINRAALACLGPVLWRLAPGGKVISGEYIARNPTRADTRAGSFKVRFLGPRAGAWADFATGDRGGDVVSLTAYIDGLPQSEAARRLARMLGLDCRGRRNG